MVNPISRCHLFPSRRHRHNDPSATRNGQSRWGVYEPVLHRTTSPSLFSPQVIPLRWRRKPRNLSITPRHVHIPDKGTPLSWVAFGPGDTLCRREAKPPLRPPTNTSLLRRVSDGSVPLFLRHPSLSSHPLSSLEQGYASEHGVRHMGVVPGNPIYTLIPFLRLP